MSDHAATPEQVQRALENCEREPVRRPGRVQSFAAVALLDRSTLRVQAASFNLAQTLGHPDAAQLLGRPLDGLLNDREAVHAVRNALALPTATTQRERAGTVTLPGGRHELAVHRQPGGDVLLEAVRLPPGRERDGASIARVRGMLTMLERDRGAPALLASAVTLQRGLTGFDRVMAYRLLPDGSGEVAAEALAPGTEPFLGLRYPATDIPQPVRDLALRMPVRVIEDIEDPHVELVGGARAAEADLTFAHGRGVSPIHVAYLRNMGVRATMTVAIIVRGELWGLFAFHHARPRRLAPDFLAVAELFGHLFSLQLQHEVEKEVLDRRRRADSIRAALRVTGEPGADGVRPTLSEALRHDWQNLAELVDAQGLALVGAGEPVAGGGVQCFGRTPGPEAVRAIADALPDEVAAAESVGALAAVPRAAEAWPGGALALTLSDEPPRRLLFFRDEVVREVRWGGRPAKEITVGPDGPRLHPRASFKAYCERVSGRSKPWTRGDTSAALELRTVLLHGLYRDAEAGVAAWRKQKAYQDLLVAELNHRVKNVLALVRSIATQTRDSAESVERYAASFESRISALVTAHDLVGGSGRQSARLDELVGTELAAYADAQRDVAHAGPPVGLRAEVASVVALVIHELATNAAKHGALAGRTGQLRVDWGFDAGGLEIVWREHRGDADAAAPSAGAAAAPGWRPERRGFGLTLIERAIPYECRGTSETFFSAEGFTARLWLPADVVVRMDGGPAASAELPGLPQPGAAADAAPRAAAPLTRGSALLVEDNMMIALETERLLADLGFAPVRSVPSADAARRALAEHRPDLAVMDINLPGGTSFGVAQELVDAGVPCIFVSGYDDGFPLPEGLRACVRLTKPVDPARLRAAVEQVCDPVASSPPSSLPPPSSSSSQPPPPRA